MFCFAQYQYSGYGTQLEIENIDEITVMKSMHPSIPFRSEVLKENQYGLVLYIIIICNHKMRSFA